MGKDDSVLPDYVMLTKYCVVLFCSKLNKVPGHLPVLLEIIIIIINPLTVRVVGAPQMTLQPVFSILPDRMNGKHDHTTAVGVSLRSSVGLCVVQLPAESWHGHPRC